MGAEASQIRISFKKAIENTRRVKCDWSLESECRILEHEKGKVKPRINSNQSSDMHGEHLKSPVSSLPHNQLMII